MSYYFIHTYIKREWYVKEYLIPSMLEQGINKDDIQVYTDTGKGLLRAFIDSIKYIDRDAWHLQDDIIISSKFKQYTEECDNGIVCGFCNKYSHGISQEVGLEDMWFSMPCIRIPINILKDFVKWLKTECTYRHYIAENKHDDLLFSLYLKEKHSNIKVYNISPNIVNHIDYLIGGSIANTDRESMSTRWNEPELIKYWEDKLNG